MCCLFGILNYSGKKNDEINYLVNCLSQEATIRGTDSTGIAYNKDGVLKIYKKPLSAYQMEFKGVEDCICISGHTRHATQGSEKKNYNNHPFMGYCDNMKFALSHNGVLWNDRALRNKYNIAENKIKTDSYIAVQLLEYFGDLNVENVSKMAEAVHGSFSFTMTDTNDTLWLVKGDSPLSIIHLPKQKMYVYASTDNILMSAISQTDFVTDIMNNNFDIIEIKTGEIMRILKSGKIVRDKFNFDNYDSYNYDWRTYRNYAWYDDFDDDDDYSDGNGERNIDPLYLEDLKYIANSLGIDGKQIDILIKEGFSLDEIEEFLYEDCFVRC